MPYFSYRSRQLEARFDGEEVPTCTVESIASTLEAALLSGRARQTRTEDQTCFALHVHGLPCSRLSTSSGLCRLSNRQPPQAAINATCCSVLPLPSRHSKTPLVIPSASCLILAVQKGSTDAHTASGGNGTGSAQIQASPVPAWDQSDNEFCPFLLAADPTG